MNDEMFDEPVIVKHVGLDVKRIQSIKLENVFGGKTVNLLYSLDVVTDEPVLKAIKNLIEHHIRNTWHDRNYDEIEKREDKTESIDFSYFNIKMLMLSVPKDKWEEFCLYVKRYLIDNEVIITGNPNLDEVSDCKILLAANNNMSILERICIRLDFVPQTQIEYRIDVTASAFSTREESMDEQKSNFNDMWVAGRKTIKPAAFEVKTNFERQKISEKIKKWRGGGQ